MKYTNTQQFNLGLKFMTGDPADDRLILNSSSDMFVNKNNTTEDNSPLFNRAYAGMIVTVADEDYETYVCINDAPYRAKTKANVTAANLSTYWKRGDQTLYNYVHTEVDNYIRTPHIKVNSEWITCSSTLSTQGIKGIDYVFDASIDSNTLEVHEKKLSGWKFRLEEIAAGDANYAEYQLQYWAPGATDWLNDTRTTIEIPKLSVLKTVRLCVAVPDTTSMGGYRVYTVEIGGEEVEVYRDDPRIDENEWKAAAAAAEAEVEGGGVYLRIEWDNDNTPPATTITYINVGEIITIDIDPLRKRLDSLENRGLIWDSSINELERRASIVDVSVNSLESSVYSYIPSAINTINSSISALKDNDASIINYINTDLADQIDVIDSSIERINSSISALKDNDTSIINFIKNDVSVNLYDKIDEVSANLDAEIKDVSDYIINTVIGDGSTGLTKQITDLNSSVSRLNSSVNNLETSVYSYLPPVINSINSSISALKDNDASIINYINTELAAQIDVIDSSIERINSSVSELESSVYSYIPPVLSSLRTDIDNVGTVIDEHVNPRLEAVEEIVSTVDVSIKELYANYIEIIGTWAAAWNALFDANPTLRKPVDPQYKDLTDEEFSYPVNAATATEKGLFVDAPVLTNIYSLPVTYTSSDINVATVDDNGVVEVVSTTGSTIVKAVFNGDSSYNSKEVSYVLTVLAPDWEHTNYYAFAKNYKETENPEYDSVIVDASDHILYGYRTDRTIYDSNLSGEQMTTTDASGNTYTDYVPVICAALKDKTAEDLSTHGVPRDGEPVPTPAVDLTDDEYSYPVAEATATELGAFVDAPVLTNTHSLPVAYTSSDTKVATINNNGEVEVVSMTGTTTIKASFAGNSSYNSKEVSYVLTVDAHNPMSHLTAEEFSYSASSYTASEFGQLSDGPVLTNIYSLPVTYTSSDINVATVDDNGVVEVVSTIGTTTIDASFAGDSSYYPKKVSYELSVLAPDWEHKNYYAFAKNYKETENPEYDSVIVDASDHILYGKYTDGTIYDSNLVDEQMKTTDASGNYTDYVPVICDALKDKTAEDLSTHGVPIDE